MRRVFLTSAVALLAFLSLTPSAWAEWVWPLRGEVITPYRNGADPYAAGQHRGIDIAGAPGATVVAAASGEVRFAGTAGSSGLTVSVRTGDGRYDTSYLHLSATTVREGDRVAAGDRVGAVGTTGTRSAAAPHLHFGVRDAQAGTPTTTRSPSCRPRRRPSRHARCPPRNLRRSRSAPLRRPCPRLRRAHVACRRARRAACPSRRRARAACLPERRAACLPERRAACPPERRAACRHPRRARAMSRPELGVQSPRVRPARSRQLRLGPSREGRQARSKAPRHQHIPAKQRPARPAKGGPTSPGPAMIPRRPTLPARRPNQAQTPTTAPWLPPPAPLPAGTSHRARRHPILHPPHAPARTSASRWPAWGLSPPRPSLA